ncbi:barstar family protein [Williamsia sterculiae]|nr:barstar family protein [Williamsia sterculiae]
MSSTPQVYRIDGSKIATPADFYVEIGRAVNGPGGYFGNNLDALEDCLRGGFGTPDDGDFVFDWEHSDESRKALSNNGAESTDGSSAMTRIADVFRDVHVPLRLR